MKDSELGFLLLTFAGLMNSSFTLPMKFVRNWAWENIWLVWTLFALLVFPLLVTVCTVPDLVVIYQTTDARQLLSVMAFGAGWGISQVFFGIAADAIGIALTFSLVLGTSAAVGALVPLLRLDPDKLRSSSGHTLLAGIAMVLFGVAICAAAGKMREIHTAGEKQGSKATAGLILAILCGCAAALMNLGIAFGARLIDTAARHGAARSNASNAVWLPLLAAGAIPNVLYCLYLLKKNSTGRNFKRPTPGNWILGMTMGILWFGSVLLYGASVARLGLLGASVGWPLFMSLIVIAASLLGLLTGEWRNCGRWPVAIQLTGVATVSYAIFLLARAAQSLT